MIRRVLEAARQAPSACNLQPRHFYVIQAVDARHRLFPAERQRWIADAPVILVACGRPTEAWVRAYDQKNHADIDVAIAMEQLVLAATEEGLSTCWICSFDPANVRIQLNLPPDLEPVAITPLGYAAETPAMRPRKTLEELVTWV